MDTKRCKLTTLQLHDYDDVKRIYVNPDVRRFLGGVITANDTYSKFADELKRCHDATPSWTVRLKGTGDFIGIVSLDNHIEGDIEVSYEFLPNWWGSGYATEVIIHVLDFAFDVLNYTKIIAETQAANMRSCRLLERIGMKCERNVQRFGAEQSIYIMNRLS